ncbi:helix-turn-helix transcriptional regulator [Vibrio salinus]|uniref:helix-turn-helix transcriptional regulator n=1 Tax=Vibrio salinus TaxID=2899784 RepID=UPI001E49DB95|nr:helix-turn-helix transcriptional regulator [Vibrio salinus]MCE0494326.1 helix-turn-helix transcriptional regulator [Vibrio salinus]
MFDKYLAHTFGDPLSQLPSNVKDALEAYFCFVHPTQVSDHAQDHSKIAVIRITDATLTADLKTYLLTYRQKGYVLLCLSNFSVPLISLYPGVWLINFQTGSAPPFRLLSAVIREFNSLDIAPMSKQKNNDITITEPLNSDSIFSLLYMMEMQLSEELREDDIADQYGYSVAYFSRTFHNLLGVSFRNYLCRKRIAFAKRLLIEQPNTKIAVVALQCGYKDLSYFNRIFKKKVGMSPGKYKVLALSS